MENTEVEKLVIDLMRKGKSQETILKTLWRKDIFTGSIGMLEITLNKLQGDYGAKTVSQLYAMVQKS